MTWLSILVIRMDHYFIDWQIILLMAITLLLVCSDCLVDWLKSNGFMLSSLLLLLLSLSMLKAMYNFFYMWIKDFFSLFVLPQSILMTSFNPHRRPLQLLLHCHSGSSQKNHLTRFLSRFYHFYSIYPYCPYLFTFLLINYMI